MNICNNVGKHSKAKIRADLTTRGSTADSLFIFGFDRNKIKINVYKRLSEIGFSFFLGVRLPYVLLERSVAFTVNAWL